MVSLMPHCRLSSVWKKENLHTDSDGERFDKRCSTIPHRFGGLFTNRCWSRIHRVKALEDKHRRAYVCLHLSTSTQGKHTGRICLQVLCTVWHLSTPVSAWQSLNVKLNCLLSKVSGKEACLNNYSLNRPPRASGETLVSCHAWRAYDVATLRNLKILL